KFEAIRTCLNGGHVIVSFLAFFFSSRRRHTRLQGDWSSDVCSSDLRSDLHDDGGGTSRLGEFWTRHPAAAEVRTFTEELVRGTREHQQKIHDLIRQFTEHWSLDRIAVVDRNILRQGIYELLWAPDVPPKVTINEA